MLLAHDRGHYRFLKGIAPYSCGVISNPGWEVVRVQAPDWLPWSEGFKWVDGFLQGQSLLRTALCAMELRSPAPFSMEGFIEFNRAYCAVLQDWQVYVGDLNPIARTNVAPVIAPPSTPCLHAFSFVRPNRYLKRPSFVVAGAGELREGTLVSSGIVRRGDVSAPAMLEKAAYVLEVMQERLAGLGMGWQQVTAVDVYTAHELTPELRQLVLDRIGPAARHGLCWHVTRPPVLEIEFEMDVRGVATEWNA